MQRRLQRHQQHRRQRHPPHHHLQQKHLESRWSHLARRRLPRQPFRASRCRCLGSRERRRRTVRLRARAAQTAARRHHCSGRQLLERATLTYATSMGLALTAARALQMSRQALTPVLQRKRGEAPLDWRQEIPPIAPPTVIPPTTTLQTKPKACLGAISARTAPRAKWKRFNLCSQRRALWTARSAARQAQLPPSPFH